MKIQLFLLILLVISQSISNGQTLDGIWSVDYVTSDSPDSLNSVGYNVISVAAFEENSFVALVNREWRNSYYIVGYKNASKNGGRLGYYPYMPNDYVTRWIDGFYQESLHDPKDIASWNDKVLITNNNEISSSIVTFELREDSVYTHPQRLLLDSKLWGIDIDTIGNVYVTTLGDSVTPGKVMIIKSPNFSPIWNETGTAGEILHEFLLPELGSPRGITVNKNGSVIYVSNWDRNEVYCYYGNVTDGYTLNSNFNFNVSNSFTTSDETNLTLGPFGLEINENSNLLFICHDDDSEISFIGHEYGRIYIVNPNTGALLDTIDVAEWNKTITGNYAMHDPDNNASGYTSTYAVDFDYSDNLYSQSYWGWTVDKWKYSETLPSIQITFGEGVKLNTYVFLEGAFNQVNGNMNSALTNFPLVSPFIQDEQKVTIIPDNVVDWILVELRNKNDKNEIIACRSGFILKNGKIVDLDGISPLHFSASEDEYYIAVKHRNHLSVMSANPIGLNNP